MVARRLVLVLAAVALSACSPLMMLDAMVPASGYKAEQDVSYGPADRQKLDVYRPTGPAAADDLVVIWFYGGGWRNGERASYRFVGQKLASLGYTAVVADYRLFPEVRFPTFNEDAALAVAWARDSLKTPDGKEPRIVLMGHSAGAHIAALVSLDPRYLEAVDVDPSAIVGTVAIAGPHAFDPLSYRSTRRIFEGTTEPVRFSPMNYARADAPPMLLIHGTEDGTVYPFNSERLANQLTQAGADADLLAVEGIGHYRIVLSLAEPFTTNDDPVLSEIRRFLGRIARS